MRKFRLLTGALLLASAASAQDWMPTQQSAYSPTVYMISAREVSTTDCNDAQQAAELNRMAVEAAKLDYIETHRPGFQQSEKPQFVFATKDNKFSFAVGGYVALRASYEFDGLVDNQDFVTYDIPVPGNYASRQKFTMDASTSRIYLKAITNTRALGRVVVYVETDFRGGAPNSYTPRLRVGYVSFKGLTFGRDVTTFCDLQAAPTTIDFQGPNAYNFNFATLIRYEVSFAKKHMTFGIAAEMPSVSGTYGDNFEMIPQRVPDIPFYLQYAWGEKRDSHIRLSGVVRNPYMHKISNDATTSLFGWGAQLSGTIKVVDWLQLFMNTVCGEGITPYIQDLTGSGLDFAPNPKDPSLIQTLHMWGAQGAAQFNITPRLFVSGGYSMVRVEHKNGYYEGDQYRQGQYAFGNIFYALTPRCHIAGEYLYGTRYNMDSANNHANRVNLLIKYNF